MQVKKGRHCKVISFEYERTRRQLDSLEQDYREEAMRSLKQLQSINLLELSDVPLRRTLEMIAHLKCAIAMTSPEFIAVQRREMKRLKRNLTEAEKYSLLKHMEAGTFEIFAR